MKKLLWISPLLCILFGLMYLALPGGVGKVQAKGMAMLPVQVENTGYTDSRGTIIVSATCPQNYHVQNGKIKIVPTAQNQGAYNIVSNGPDAQNRSWVLSVENKVAGTLSITVTAICVH